MVFDRFAEGRERRRAGLDRVRGSTQGVITDLAELDVRSGEGLSKEAQARMGEGRTKLQEARAAIERMPTELGDLTAGIEEELLRIGYSVTQVRAFTTWERVLVFLGDKNGAEKSRLERLKKQSVKETVGQLTAFILGTIKELKEIEGAYESAEQAYGVDTARALEKLKIAQPLYQEAVLRRQQLEAELKTLKLELESGVVSAEERPAKEKQLDDLQRSYHTVHLQETDLLIIIKDAQETIQELQKNRDAALETIKSIHGMRRHLLEKQEGFRSLLEHAMTGVLSAARIERFNAVDPAFNKVITLITETNLQVMAGAADTFTDRLSKAAIDPDTSLRLAQQLARDTAEFLAKIEAIAEEVEKGPRAAAAPDEGGRDEPAAASWRRE